MIAVKEVLRSLMYFIVIFPACCGDFHVLSCIRYLCVWFFRLCYVIYFQGTAAGSYIFLCSLLLLLINFTFAKNSLVSSGYCKCYFFFFLTLLFAHFSHWQSLLHIACLPFCLSVCLPSHIRTNFSTYFTLTLLSIDLLELQDKTKAQKFRLTAKHNTT